MLCRYLHKKEALLKMWRCISVTVTELAFFYPLILFLLNGCVSLIHCGFILHYRALLLSGNTIQRLFAQSMGSPRCSGIADWNNDLLVRNSICQSTVTAIFPYGLVLVSKTMSSLRVQNHLSSPFLYGFSSSVITSWFSLIQMFRNSEIEFYIRISQYQTQCIVFVVFSLCRWHEAWLTKQFVLI